MAKTYAWIVVFTVVSAVVLCDGKSSKKPLSIVLDARWNHTPFHLEASEFFAEESNDAFWKFVTDFQTLDLETFKSSSQQKQYESIIELANRQLSNIRLSLLKLSLGLRAHSPAVETFQQIARDKKLPTECNFVLEFSGNRHTCDLNKLDDFLQESKDTTSPILYTIDHEFGSNLEEPIVILYADMAHTDFGKYHNALLKRHAEGKLRYILRHFVPRPVNKLVRLGGYGVELAIKSTEYKSQDDTKYTEEAGDENHDEIHASNDAGNDDFDIHSFMDDELSQLKENEMSALSLQTAMKILKAPVDQQLRLFRDLAQNFPSVARSLVNIKVDDDVKRDIERNKKYFQSYLNLEATDTALFINGLYYDLEISDAFVLLDSIKQETRLLEGLHNAGVDKETIPKLMKLDLTNKNTVYGVDFRDSAVMYINDIETDKEYRSWPRSLQEMLRPTYPGMLRSVRRNLYHLIIVGDPAHPDSRDMFKFAESFFIHRAPVRIGIVFGVNSNLEVNGFSDGGVALLNAFNFISQEKKPYDGLSFITEVYAGQADGYIEPERVHALFKEKYPKEDLELVFGADSDYDTGRMLAWDFINRTGIGAPPVAMLNGILLKKEYLKGDMFEEGTLTEIMKQTPKIQRAIYRGDLADDDNVLDYLMTRDNIMPRLNDRILNPPENSRYVDLSGRAVPNLKADDVQSMSSDDLGASFASSLKYAQSRNDGFRPLTVWVIVDLETKNGKELLLNGLEHVSNSDELRLSVLYNNQNLVNNKFTQIVHSALESLKPSDARVFLVKLLRNYEKIESGEKKPEDFLSSGTFEMLSEEVIQEAVALHISFVRLLRVGPGERAVVSTGKLIGPLGKDEVFNTDDFNLLEKFSLAQFGDNIKKLLSKSDLALKATAVLQRFVQQKTRHEIRYATDKQGVISVPARDPDQAAHEIIAVVDPVSRGAQKLSQILLLLQSVVNANVRVFLNCAEGHKELPLKTYYRFVADSEPQFSANGDFTNGPMAAFMGLPSKPILTLAMATPENWLIGAARSIYDLDNIRMADVESRVSAEFELEHLLVEGHCFELSSGSPPRGLEFTLGTATSPVMYDTIVMANLGYFQLKANPGTWYLRLRNGRSTDLYTISTTENAEKSEDSQDASVIVTNFRSKVLKIRVEKKPGKENEELLVDSDEQPDGIWNSITSSISGKKDKADESDDDVINIFSVATGHLYERLLRIMMLSVMKNTNSKVKFWFLKNYLSPTMKDILPFYAKKYGFEYQLVEYKWPRWLNQQTEKQRIIWGYKILFLDVLFPLSVKKIIFVDADQIVRADLKELVDLDLGGAPYGYTPFCDSREDMEGFRFWKKGYWSSHLGHRKYHISALYVVDLKKFRRIAAGDRLRGQYQGLSQDPNSLSNLDQDLPNNMIHQVAIKSLPQEWLWCETWCDDVSKKTAKTIDLCNNPKTKEPKLVAAARIVPEWTSYDEELKKMIQEFESLKKASSASNSASDASPDIVITETRAHSDSKAESSKSSEDTAHKQHIKDHSEL